MKTYSATWCSIYRRAYLNNLSEIFLGKKKSLLNTVEGSFLNRLLKLIQSDLWNVLERKTYLTFFSAN